MPIAINPNVHISGDLYVTLDNEEVLVKGTTATGAAVTDAPVMIGAQDPSNQVLDLECTAAGELFVDVAELPTEAVLDDATANPTTTLIGACNLGWDAVGSHWERVLVIAGAMVVDTELPAAGALADNMANPTTPLIGACNMVFDGAQWDRVTLAALTDAFANPAVTGTGAFSMVFNPTAVDWDRMITVEGGDAQSTGLLGTGLYVYNTATWDRVLEGALPGSVLVDTELPAAAALADNMANPTTPLIGACNMVFDGTQWDRVTLAALTDAFANPSVTGTGAFQMGWSGGDWDRLITVEPGDAQLTGLLATGGYVWNGVSWDRVAEGPALAGSVLVDTELPAAAALADNMGNPTTPLIGVCNMVFDGGNWDRVTLAALTDAFANPSVTGTGAFEMVYNNVAGDWDRRISVEALDAANTGLAATGLYGWHAGGAHWDRVHVDAAGNLAVAIVGAGVIDTELPAAGVLADNMANPTTPLIGACNMVFDGAQWDRVTLAALTDAFANPSVTGTGAFGMVWHPTGTDWDRAISAEEGDGVLTGLPAVGGFVWNGASWDMIHEGVVAGSVLVDTELPTAAALADNMGNPTTPLIGACNMVFDGTQWDRVTLAALADAFANPSVTGTGAFGMVFNQVASDWDRMISVEKGDAALLGLLAAGGYVYNGATWDRATEGAAPGSARVDPYYDPTRAIGTSGADAAQTVSTATEPCKILFVTCKWSAAVTKDVTITLNAGAGGAYDTLLQTIVFTNETDGVWFPDSDVIIMNDDQLDVVAPAGGGGVTSAVQIYTQPVAA